MASLPSPAETTPTRVGPRGRDLLRALAEGTAGEIGEEFLRSLVRSLADAFDAKLAMVAEATTSDGTHVRVLAGWYDGAPMPEPFEYDTDGAPCALVAERPVVAVPNALVERFPDYEAAIDMGLDSYLAVCLRAADGTHLGHLAVLDARPMEADDDEIAALRVFASRAAAELERRRQAAALEASRARVVQAGDAERRRIGRDLHDGAQQRLVVAHARAAESLGETCGARSVDGPQARRPGVRRAARRGRRRAARPRRAASILPCSPERGLRRRGIESLATRSAVPVELGVTRSTSRLPLPVETGRVLRGRRGARRTSRSTPTRRTPASRSRRDRRRELVVEVRDGVGGARADAGSGHAWPVRTAGPGRGTRRAVHRRQPGRGRDERPRRRAARRLTHAVR